MGWLTNQKTRVRFDDILPTLLKNKGQVAVSIVDIAQQALGASDDKTVEKVMASMKRAAKTYPSLPWEQLEFDIPARFQAAAGGGATKEQKAAKYLDLFKVESAGA